MDVKPAVVTMHVWGAPVPSLPRFAVTLLAARHGVVRRHGARFARALGTATGGRLTLAGADPRHWALLACWPSASAAASFERSTLFRRVDRLADERLTARLSPLSSTGRWSGRTPFGGSGGRAQPADEPVAVLTRARVRARHLPAFARAAGSVAADLPGREGLRLALGFGEAPVGMQGTFSVWDSARAMAEFAYQGAAHRQVILRTTADRWYAEDLFARFAVLDVSGTYLGRSVRHHPVSDQPVPGRPTDSWA